MCHRGIYLASTSSRRQALLRQLGVPFDVLTPQISEEPVAGEIPRAYVARLARAKADAGDALARAAGWPRRPVLGADTAVVLAGEILGKPRDRAHGLAMLRRLSARTHEVLTGVCLLNDDDTHEALVASRVTFAPLSPAEIERYWETGEPADKAGAYAVQGRAAAFITRIEGSYSGIVGLPLFELTQLLKRLDGDSRCSNRHGRQGREGKPDL